MTTLFEITLGSAEPVDQKVAKPRFSAFEVVGRIHGPEHIVLRDTAVERGHHTRDPLLADPFEDVVFLHKYIRATRTFGSL